jgi:glycosyltransferase involved in cell wall biosynthesis
MLTVIYNNQPVDHFASKGGMENFRSRAALFARAGVINF